MDYERAGPGKKGFRYKRYITIEKRKKYRRDPIDQDRLEYNMGKVEVNF